jgi:tetrahydromethanopterin S-methyltransferase subunit F
MIHQLKIQTTFEEAQKIHSFIQENESKEEFQIILRHTLKEGIATAFRLGILAGVVSSTILFYIFKILF